MSPFTLFPAFVFIFFFLLTHFSSLISFLISYYTIFFILEICDNFIILTCECLFALSLFVVFFSSVDAQKMSRGDNSYFFVCLCTEIVSRRDNSYFFVCRCTEIVSWRQLVFSRLSLYRNCVSQRQLVFFSSVVVQKSCLVETTRFFFFVCRCSGTL